MADLEALMFIRSLYNHATRAAVPHPTDTIERRKQAITDSIIEGFHALLLMESRMDIQRLLNRLAKKARTMDKAAPEGEMSQKSRERIASAYVHAKRAYVYDAQEGNKPSVQSALHLAIAYAYDAQVELAEDQTHQRIYGLLERMNSLVRDLVLDADTDLAIEGLCEASDEMTDATLYLAGLTDESK